MKGKLLEEVFCERKLTIYLPPSYLHLKMAFPVLYVQDGKSLFFDDKYSALNKLESLFTAQQTPEVILVGVESNKRADDYTPWYASAISAKYDDFGGKGGQYLAFVVNSLKPYIASKYHVDTDYHNNGIAGASIGGLISLYAAFLYPEEFGKIGAISPSVWYERFIEYMKQEALPVENKKIYLDVGSEEGFGKPNPLDHMVEYVKEAYEILKSKGLHEKNLKLFIEEAVVHNEEVFRNRFPYVVSWLFKHEAAE
jgi:Predicted hydrolase of the alpha/beta superfamily